MFATALELLNNNQLGRVTSCLICLTACMAYADLASQSVLAHCFCVASMLMLALLLSALLNGKCPYLCHVEADCRAYAVQSA